MSDYAKIKKKCYWYILLLDNLIVANVNIAFYKLMVLLKNQILG